MKKFRWMYPLLLVAVCLLPVMADAREISPVVDTLWLEQNLTNPKLSIVDIRKVEEYKEGHLPNAVNAFYGSWAVGKGGLDNQLPEDDDLLDAINSAGINNDSLVVIVGKTDALVELANATRVAWTLKYAGLENFAILDGGYNKWVEEKKAVSKEMSKAKPGNYKPQWNKNVLTTKDYVQGQAGKSKIIDARLPDFFFGVSKLPIVEKAGHIPGAASLPAAWVFTKEGTFKSTEEIAAMAKGVSGKNKPKEIITYCDTGRLASVDWFILNEMLSYKNVRNYDGSMQEWGKDPATAVVKYSWK